MEPPEPPITMDNVDQLVEWMFAPWVRSQGHEVLEVEEGRVVTRLAADPEQSHFAGTLCGQAIMSAVDTAMAIAMMTVEPIPTSGTAQQSTRFLRPAAGEAVVIEARVLKAGKRTWYGEIHVRDEDSDKLVAHATSEFV